MTCLSILCHKKLFSRLDLTNCPACTLYPIDMYGHVLSSHPFQISGTLFAFIIVKVFPYDADMFRIGFLDAFCTDMGGDKMRKNKKAIRKFLSIQFNNKFLYLNEEILL